MRPEDADVTALREEMADLARQCASLSAELHRARIILDSVADGITVHDARGKLLYANDAAARLIGLESSAEMLELAGPAILDRFDVIDELERPLDRDRLPGRIALREKRDAETLIGYRDRATGETHWSIIHAAPVLDPTGELEVAVNIFRDVTARRRADAARRFIHDKSQEMVRSLDVDAALDTLARAFAARLADYCLVYLLDEHGQLERRAEASHDEDREPLVRQLRRFTVDPGEHSPPWRAVRTKQTVLAEDIDPATLVSMARTPEWLALVKELGVHSTLTIPLIARDEAIGAVGLVLSDRARVFTPETIELAEALADRGAMAVLNARLYASEQAARRAAEDVARAREQLLAVVSHDLRTPLTASSMALGALEASLSDDDDNRRAISIIKRSTESMHRLISDLLDLARINAGTLRIDKQLHELEPILHESVQLLAPIAEEKRQRLAIEGDCAGAKVACDRGRIFQVMSNLVGNAIKFTPEGGSVTVHLGREPDGIVVRVHDDGPGIDPAELDRVFERYWQKGSAGDEGGIGLGLSIAKGIVEAHGGAIEVSSAPGAGSVFAFTLPA